MKQTTKEIFAINLITQRTIQEAAVKSGISLSTAYKVRKDVDFQSILQTTKNAMFAEAMHKSQGLVLEALETLKEIMCNKNSTDSSRVAAAKTIIEMGADNFVKENILNRIKKLEEETERGEI